MGLDMYLRAEHVEEPESEWIEESYSDGTTKKVPPTVELGYWRKHPNLHDHMKQIWEESEDYKEDYDFNCVPVKLSDAQLIDIIKRTVNDDLAQSKGGFFFGETQEHHKWETIKIMSHALKYRLENPGCDIVYDSWW